MYLNADLHVSNVKPCSKSEFHYRFITKIESLSKSASKLSLESKFSKLCGTEYVLCGFCMCVHVHMPCCKAKGWALVSLPLSAQMIAFNLAFQKFMDDVMIQA